MNDIQKPEAGRSQAMAGFVILACASVAVISLVAAFLVFGKGDRTGGGCCLIASSLAAGLLANAVLRR